MRTLVAIASLGLLIGAGVGCGDDTTAPATMDLAVGADMTVVIPHDMMKLTCTQVVSCAATATSVADAAACLSEAKSPTTVTALLNCAFDACGPVDGGGTGMCMNATDTSQPCQGCLGTVIQGALSGGSTCMAQGQACLSDS